VCDHRYSLLTGTKGTRDGIEAERYEAGRLYPEFHYYLVTKHQSGRAL
jgi:hypothetical protein